MIEIKSLSKNFNVYQKDPGLKASIKALFKREYLIKNALKNINLNINSNEILGLIGANGAGKTTLVKILSGIIHSDIGKVSVNGHNPWDRKNEFKKSISLVMGQKAQLWWDLPAYDSYLLLKEIYQVPNKKFKHNLEELTQVLDIKEQIKVPVRKLSLGERMKVELIAALLHNPKVIFLDEPTIGLDITSQKNVRTFLKKYHQEYKPLIILTSHYMQDIEELCPRIVLMKSGEIIYDGSLERIKEKNREKQKVELITKKEETIDLISFLKAQSEIKDLMNQENKIIFKVNANYISKLLKEILKKYNLLSFNITDPDIGDVIESYLIGSNS